MTSDGGLRRLLRKHLPQVHWTTVESRSTEGGIPDIEGCWEGRTFWIECKTTSGWAVHLRPAQVAWILRRVRAGGRVVVLVRQRGRGRDDLWMVAGAGVRALRVGGLRGAGVPVLGCWAGGPAGWAWRAGVLRALAGAGGR